MSPKEASNLYNIIQRLRTAEIEESKDDERDCGMDEKSVFRRVSHTITAYYQYKYTDQPKFQRVLLDTDLNAKSGYSFGGIEGEYLIENMCHHLFF